MSYRYRAYPEGTQGQCLRHCWDDRAIWNVACEQFRMWRPRRRPTPSRAERARRLTEARRSIEWLAEGSSSVRRQALRIFDKAVSNYFGGTHARPTFRKRSDKLGFTIRDVHVRKLSRKWAEVQIPKHGTNKAAWVRFRLSRPLPADHGMARITRDTAGRWHVSFTAAQPEVTDLAQDRQAHVVGIDRGIVNTAAYSEPVAGADLAHIPGLTPKEAERLVRLQRNQARQRKGSTGWYRTKAQIARLYAREADRAKDWVEQQTTALVRHARLVVLEDLRVEAMSRSAVGTLDSPTRGSAAKRGLNRELRRSRWGMFERRLTDKAKASSAVVIKVPAAYSSQECARCGHTTAENRESQAVFRCRACGHQGHADIEAAHTIRERGIAHLGQILALAAGLVVAAPGDLQPLGGSGKGEPTKSGLSTTRAA